MKETYEKIVREKLRFVMIALTFAFIFYFLLPVSLIFFPDTMNRISIIPGVTWAWVYAFMQIIMVWLLGLLYHRKSKKIDEQIDRMIQEE